jgi:hypothetical protein
MSFCHPSMDAIHTTNLDTTARATSPSPPSIFFRFPSRVVGMDRQQDTSISHLRLNEKQLLGCLHSWPTAIISQKNDAATATMAYLVRIDSIVAAPHVYTTFLAKRVAPVAVDWCWAKRQLFYAIESAHLNQSAVSSAKASLSLTRACSPLLSTVASNTSNTKCTTDRKRLSRPQSSHPQVERVLAGLGPNLDFDLDFSLDDAENSQVDKVVITLRWGGENKLRRGRV